MKKLLFVLATLCALFAFKGLNASADYAEHIDGSGKITGHVNATYYDVSSWSDMYDAYNDSSQDTVYLNVTQDLPGDPSNGYEKGAKVKEGKSLTILGNNHKLYFGESEDPNQSTYVEANGAKSKHYGFYAVDPDVTSQTTLRLENAIWINSITYGIFQINYDASATTQYHNVIEMNGSSSGGATPLINRVGKIEFSGTNVFNVTGTPETNFGSGKRDSSSLGNTNTNWHKDQAGWIHGANNVDITDGSTTLNMNSTSNVFYHFNNSKVDVATLNVGGNARLVWNIDNSDYLEDYYLGYPNTRKWKVNEGGSFLINGTSNTSPLKWSPSPAFNSKYIVKDNASFDATTAGALNASTSYNSKIKVGKGSNFSISNDAKACAAITGMFLSGIDLQDTSHFLARTEGQKAFQGLGAQDTSIRLNGQGLIGKFANNYEGANAINEGRAVGSIKTSLNTSDFDVNPAYSRTDRLNIRLWNNAYIEFGTLSPVFSLVSNGLDRTFSINASDLPRNSNGFSDYISGDGPMGFTVQSNVQNPNVSVQVSVKNNFTNKTQYWWRKNNNSYVQLGEGNQTIWKRDEDASTSDDGYTFSNQYANDYGLRLKTTNSWKNGSYDTAATFNYTLVTGPSS